MCGALTEPTIGPAGGREEGPSLVGKTQTAVIVDGPVVQVIGKFLVVLASSLPDRIAFISRTYLNAAVAKSPSTYTDDQQTVRPPPSRGTASTTNATGYSTELSVELFMDGGDEEWPRLKCGSLVRCDRCCRRTNRCDSSSAKSLHPVDPAFNLSPRN